MEILILSIEELGTLFVESIPVGFLIGCFPMLIGYVQRELFNIFKRV